MFVSDLAAFGSQYSTPPNQQTFNDPLYAFSFLLNTALNQLHSFVHVRSVSEWKVEVACLIDKTGAGCNGFGSVPNGASFVCLSTID
jgi:hypothetical protein